MRTIKTISDLQHTLESHRKQGASIGFVPTMGALHSGHIRLVTLACAQTDICVSSIYVNPTQFNNPDDLAKYPRMPESDLAMLQNAGCAYAFLPNDQAMYADTAECLPFNFGTMESVMEGKFRPGHFAGVATIVDKLFDIVRPHKAYFGLKDFQQVAIIKALIAQKKLDLELVAVETVREADGLAMSSRNLRLSASHRAAAPLINDTLAKSKEQIGQNSVQQVKEWVENRFAQQNLLEIEYFEIVDSHSLNPISDWEQCTSATACIAVYAGDVRLIDNITYY